MLFGIHVKSSWHFPLKDNVQHLRCVIYNDICSCGETYVGKTIRNCKIKWDEHNDVDKNSEPAKHLAVNIEHEFSWYVLTRAAENTLEAHFIKLIVLSLNEQLDNNVLMLFRNGVTWRRYILILLVFLIVYKKVFTLI